MAPLLIEGDSPGQRFRNYNNIVNNANLTDVPEISYEESDFDNFFKIDIACRNKNVDYILKVFQSEDMLYVSRAIKRSTWLVTDEQYADIINPHYLYEHLQQKMMPKAFNKLLLHIRLNLKNENRAEQFYNYYEKYNLKVACKWLSLCSLVFVAKVIRKRPKDISESLLQRLCEKSIWCLDVYIRNYYKPSYRYNAMQVTRFTMNYNLDLYIMILNECDKEEIPLFRPKQAKFLMNYAPNKTFSNLDRFSRSFPALSKYIKREDMKEFILTNLKNKTSLCSWFTPNRFEKIIDRLPEDNRFEFIKKVFIDQKNEDLGNEVLIPTTYSIHDFSTSEDIYLWYKFAPFNIALEELKKLIRSEPKPSERTAMFEVLLTCANENVHNISTLLKFFRQNHVHEPVNCKTRFIELVLQTNTTHHFDKDTWKYFNDIVSRVNIYKGSDALVQSYIKSVILYHVVRDENIANNIEDKFSFDTFKIYQKKITKDEKEKLFLYLYRYIITKINNCDVNNENEYRKVVDLLKKSFILLLDWDKELEDFPVILYKIKEICEIKKKTMWDIDLIQLYNTNNSWKKLLISESIILSPTEQTCINALKLKPDLLKEYQSEIEAICLNHKKPSNRYLKKIRLYYPQTLVKIYKDLFINKVNDISKHKAIITGLFTLLPRHEILKFLQQYAPVDANIDSKQSKVDSSIRKHAVRSIHFVRPLISLTTAMLYAQGDYLRYILPSLDFVAANTSSLNAREHIAPVLDSSVSLQKLGIRVAIDKLKHEELTDILPEIWKTNVNRDIRVDIFKRTFNKLCDACDEDAARCIIKILDFFIENSKKEDNEFINTELIKADQVPKWVRGEFWMKSYNFFQTNPPNSSCIRFHKNLYQSMIDVMEFLDDDFVTDIFLESFDEKFSTSEYKYQHLVAIFLLSTKTEQAHVKRFNKLLTPILDRSLAMWDTHDNSATVRQNLQDIFKYLDEEFPNFVLKEKMVIPSPMYRHIVMKLKQLNFDDNYTIITSRKLALDCVQSFENIINSNLYLKYDWNETYDIDLQLLYELVAKEIGRVYAKYLKEDLNTYFPSINSLFAKSCNEILKNYKFSMQNKIDIMKIILKMLDSVEGYLAVMEFISMQFWSDSDKAEQSEVLDIISKHPSKEVKMHYHLIKLKLVQDRLVF